MKRQLWITLVTYLAYCIDKELYKAIDYLREQVRVLLEQQEKQNKRILLTNSQRMKVAAKAKRLSRRMLEQCTVLFTPDTILGWFRRLIAEKYDGSKNRKTVGRPMISQEVIDLVIKFKKENLAPSLAAGFCAKALDATKGTFGIGDRSQSIDLPADDVTTLRVFIDRCIIEVYVNGYAITFVGYPDPDHQGLRIIEKNPAANIQYMDIWEMKSMWDT